MKTEEILNIDFQKEENQKLIQKVLMKIKPLSKYEDGVPIEALERTIVAICKKYNVDPQWISVSIGDGENNKILYSCGVKTHDTSEWLGTVYASCIYELYAKLCIKLFSESKKQGLRKPTAAEKERMKEAKKIKD